MWGKNEAREIRVGNTPGERFDARAAGCVAAADRIDRGMETFSTASPVGAILGRIHDIEQATDSVMREIAILADRIGPALSSDDSIPPPSSYPDKAYASEGDSVAALRLATVTSNLNEVARTLEALRRRVQL